MKWTEHQQLAIDKDNTNIIVSAGAGSGKTAVLSERVIRKLNQNIDINRLLVLTFTNEAAKEMKHRIREKIKQNPLLKDQLEYLDQAYITTFDSYSLSLVKKYHHILNVNKNLSIIDSNIIKIRKKEILNDIFNELYKNKDEKFLKLINDFCTKDDEELKKQILKINEGLNLKIDKENYLNNYIENFYKKENLNNICNDYLSLIKDIIDNMKEYYQDIKSLDEEYLIDIEENLNKFFNSKTYTDIKNNYIAELGKIRTKKEAQPIKEKFSELNKELANLLIYKNEEEIINEILSTKCYVEVIIKIINSLEKILLKEKQKNDTYEFIDIAKMAIKLVKENNQIRNELKEYYNEIMIDEYQDTSDIQEEFISLIENNNVYMVGDIKQSIYGFRNANPNIFKEKYEKYKNGINGAKIDLLNNFRSRQEVIDAINNIFNLIMDLKIGGADYKSSHKLLYGFHKYDLENCNNDIEIYNYDEKDKTFTKEEKEIFIIAKDIKEKIKNNYRVYDKKSDSFRCVNYSDFCIIMDRDAMFDKYKKIFEYLGIPLNIYKDSNLTDDDIIYIFKNILKLIIKVKDKNIDKEFIYSFISISRSFLINYTDDYIFDIYSNNLYQETSLYKKIDNIVKEIDNLNLSRIIEFIIDEFNIYEKLIEVGNIKENIIKIEQVIELSNTLNDIGYTYRDFYNYIEEMTKEEIEIKYNLSISESESVKIMNIHKSKGLEFPICYFSGLYKEFNKQELNARFLYSNKYGIITPVLNEGIKTTILKTLLKKEKNNEEVSEKIRLFYVALTRAREKIILVAPLNDDYIEIKDIINDKVRLEYNSFLDIINSVKDHLEDNIKNIDLNNIYITKDYDKKKDIEFNFKNENKVLNIKEITIEKEVEKSSRYSKNLVKITSEKEINNMKEGLRLHYMLEIDDFLKPKYDVTKKLIKHLNLNNCKIYKEYEFIYEKDNIDTHGIIDLVLEYPNNVIIIDYKLDNTDDVAYIKQLNGYKAFIEAKTKKETEIYLYSITKDSIIKL